MKTIVVLICSAFFAMAYELLLETLRGTALDNRPGIALIIMGLFGAISLSIGYFFGQRSILYRVAKNKEEDATED